MHKGEIKMAYKAIIKQVEKTDDRVIVDIEFTNGVKSFSKKYPFLHINDLNVVFDDTIQSELKRINDLETGYTTLKAREDEEIILLGEK